MSERIDFEPLAGEDPALREDRVVRRVLERIGERPSSAALSSAILTLSRFALPIAILAAAVTAVAASRLPRSDTATGMSAARALGVSFGVEQLIRRPEPPSIDEFLNAFGSGQ